ncbi:MAG TPA: CapA family protein [Saprospiraceae bacterium]|nr:CapA family protein [Saprospiraceae bacterium]
MKTSFIHRYLLCLPFCCLSLTGFAQDSLMSSRLHLAFVGDIMGHDSQIASAMVIKDSLYDYSPCFEFVSPILRQADLAIGNLELTLPGEGPYKGYPRFRSPDDLALALRHAGFDLLVTANNHSNDGNRQGVEQTIHTLRDYHFYQTGTFLNAMEREIYYPLIVYKGTFKLAFLNYTYGTNGLPTPKPNVVNLIDEETIKADLEEARALNPDFIIVIMHWGNEYQINESKEQKGLAEKILSWGGDLIVGAHPHVVQPVKKVKVERPGQGSYEGLVAYSLGNFISGQRKKLTDIGIILEVTLEKHKNQTQLIDSDYIPVFRHIEANAEGKKVYRIVPVAPYDDNPPPTSFMPAAIYQKMQATTKALRNHLKKFDSRERSVSLPQNQ